MMEKGDDGGVQPVNGGVTVDMSENGITHVKDLAFYENKLWEILLRLLAFIFTFIATIIMSVAKENTTVQIQISTSLDTIPLVIRAKSIYTSAFVWVIKQAWSLHLGLGFLTVLSFVCLVWSMQILHSGECDSMWVFGTLSSPSNRQ